MKSITATRTISRNTLLVVCISALPLPALAATSTNTQTVGSIGTETAQSTAAVVPSALRPVFYQSLAKDAGAAYNIDAHGCAALPKQPLKACFGVDGARFTGAGHAPLALRLVAHGRRASLNPVKTVHPETAANRVTYSYNGVTEWWRVLPVGFEQGFTVNKRPHGAGELVLVLALATSHQASQSDADAADGTLAFGKMRYGQLVVTDAKGQVIPATMSHIGDRILIAVNDAHAAYPLTVDPLVYLEQKVTASDGAASDEFGFSVSVSGSTAFVGARFGVGTPTSGGPGVAYVFTYLNGVWSQTQKLTGSDSKPFDDFGQSVAVNGSIALVGSLFATDSQQGATYVFTKSGGTWSQTAELTADDGVANDFFGNAVALDGSTALVGAPSATVGSNTSQGAAYVFTNSGGIWSQEAKLTANDGAAYDQFGYSAALSGGTALVGSIYAAVNGNSDQGAVYAFTDSSGAWAQAQKILSEDGASSDYFGYSVAIDGATVLIGAFNKKINGNFAQGAAYVFTGTDGSWTQTQELTASDGGTTGDFGRSVALEGTSAVVGANDLDLHQSGQLSSAYVFVNSNRTWNQTQILHASDQALDDNFGEAVSLSGATILVGADGVHGGEANGTGAAYFYAADTIFEDGFDGPN